MCTHSLPSSCLHGFSIRFSVVCSRTRTIYTQTHFTPTTPAHIDMYTHYPSPPSPSTHTTRTEQHLTPFLPPILFPLQVMLESFLQAQKVSVRKSLQRSFRRYVTYGEENNQLIMHQLQNLITEVEKYKMVRYVVCIALWCDFILFEWGWQDAPYVSMPNCAGFLGFSFISVRPSV
jgi:hypothetical protein